jgi:hypothetical protein
MAKFYSILSIINLIFGFSVFGQHIFIFPEINSAWIDSSKYEAYSVGGNNYNRISKSQYYTNGDTIITNWYVKIYKRGWTEENSSSFEFPTITYTCDDYYGGMRADSTEKVFFLKSGDSTEFLMYDFQIPIGDTFPEDIIWTDPHLITCQFN